MKSLMKDKKVLVDEINALPEWQQVLAFGLLDKIMFYEDELQKLQKQIPEVGWTEEYKNGANQHGMKKSAVADSYNNAMKIYITALEKLNKLLSTESKASRSGADPLLKALHG